MTDLAQQTRTRARREMQRLRRLAHRGRAQVESRLPLSSNARALAALQGKHAGERVFVVGNGPSLTPEDLDRIVGQPAIASNGIFLMFPRTAWRPAYLTVEDALVAQDRSAELRAVQGPTKVFPMDLRRHLPKEAGTVHVHFRREYRPFPRFSHDLRKVAYFGGTVTYLNLQLARFLGAREIVLLGVDHNYAPPDQKDRVEGHVITSSTADVNHFDPGYFGPGYRWHDPNVARMEAAYREARRALDAVGVPVWNATRGGRLEVFPRRSLEEVLG